MNISVGIVGLPNTGKSTLFNAITKKSVPAENYPFCTIDPSVGVVQVPDERLEKLAAFSNSKEIIPAVVEFVDIAGLVKGAADGGGLGNAFLSHIREVDAIAHMVRCFVDTNVIHVDGEINPQRDIEVIETELILADVQLVERRLEKLVKDVKRNEKDAVKEKELLDRVLAVLNKGERLSKTDIDADERKTLSALGLLTVKPMFYIANIGVASSETPDLVAVVEKHAQQTGSDFVTISAHTEQELSGLSREEAQTLRAELLSEGHGIDTVIQTAFKTLNLVSYFTTGEKETRAWTVVADSTAPVAARAIHTDFEKNFIRAEVTSYPDFVDAGSFSVAREKGTLRVEGREYIVQDGDVITFLTN